MCNKLDLILWSWFDLGPLVLFCGSNRISTVVSNLLVVMDVAHPPGLMLWLPYVCYVFISFGGLVAMLLGLMVVLFYPWLYNA